MPRPFFLSLLLLLAAAHAVPPVTSTAHAARSAQASLPPLVATFTTSQTEHRWELKNLALGLPADWSPWEYLTLDVKASSPQRFQFLLYTADGTRRLNFNPFQGAWCRVSVPLEYFQRPGSGHDLASVSNRSHPSSFLNRAGSFGPIRAVQAIAVSMAKPIGSPALELRNLHLTKGQPEDAVLEPKPLVDEFGQWIPAQWPGKAASLEDLKKVWQAEEAQLKPGDFDTCSYGGFRAAPARKATGFFRVEQVDGKWWLVDPDGHLFFSVGADCMGMGAATSTVGRDGVFAALPPASLRALSSRARKRPGQSRMASFYTWNLARRFGPEWEPKWIDLTARRMDAWGLNTIANWSDPRLWDAHRKPYIVNLSWGMETAGFMGLPDVFSEEFARSADAAAAEQCAPRKTDPYMIGYFIANEPPWPGREGDVARLILDGPATATQRELKAWLTQGGDTPERRKAFIYRCFEKFLEVTGTAVKKHDPNHMNLGLRFGGHAPDEMIRACRVFDVFSMNSYTYAVDRKTIDHIAQLTGRPIMIGEFHFGTPGRGLDSGLKQTANQAERGVAYQYYIEQAAAIPALVGAHWFQWIDEPATGRSDGENYNIGVVDVTDRPYPELVEAMKATHKRLLAVHSGQQPPTTRQARQQ